MAGPVLIIRRDELNAAILGAAGDDSSAGVAEAVERFLREREPQLAALLSVRRCTEGIAITATGKGPLDMLRAVEGVLGIEDRLPEVVAAEDLPEIEVEQEEFSLSVVERPEPQLLAEEILRSKVRYFPLPTCQWFEISEGDLVLTAESITFEPRRHITADQDADTRGFIIVPLTQVKALRRDYWLNVPCIRIETAKRAYRYGWPAWRQEPETIFEVEEWLDTFGALREWKR